MTLNSSSAAGAVNDLLHRANACLQTGALNEAFEVLIEAKARRVPVAELDTTRGVCFLKMGRLDEAREAFREELRHFPTSTLARQALTELEVIDSGVGAAEQGDEEFSALLKVIRPYTMLSVERLYSLFSNAKRLCESDLPGNFVECGVAAGGSSALLAYVIRRYSKQPRFLYSFDSFSGMPPAGQADTHAGLAADATGWGTGTCAAPESSLLEVCTKLGVTDVVRPVKGYFEDTLPVQRDWVGMVALLHLDGDWYSSTRAILENLYDRVVKAGFLQIDDYGHWDGCRKAVHEFETERRLSFSLTRIDATGVTFSKQEGFPMNPAVNASAFEQFSRDDIVNHGITTQMSANERFQVYSAIRCWAKPAAAQPLRFIEVGSFAGASLLLSYTALRRNSAQVKVIAVEPEGQPQFHDVIRALGNDVQHIKKFSDAAATEIAALYAREGCAADVILIDGDHTYEGVYRDIECYLPLLKTGGIMIFHDFLPPLSKENTAAIFYHHGNKEPGIRRACQELMEQRHGCEVIEMPLLYPTDPTQTQPQLPIIPGVMSTIRIYRKR